MKLNRKAAKSMAFLRAWAPLAPEQYEVFISGGKDSAVLEHIVRRSGAAHKLYYNDSAIEPPEGKPFIRRYWPGAIWIRRDLNYWQLLIKNGYPSIRRPWCCYHIKEKNHPLAGGRFRVVGVRSAESNRRKAQTAIQRHTHRRIWYFKPLFDWSDEDVWEYIDRHNLPIHPVYTEEGWSRMGCVICPWITSKNRIRVDAHKRRWPGLYFLFEKKMREVYALNREKWQAWNPDQELVDPETFIDNWYRGDIKPYLPRRT